MNLLTLWSAVLPETLIFPQLLKKLTSLRGTWRLISLFTTACQVVFNLSHVHTIHTLSPIHLKSILSSHLCPVYVLPSWWFVMQSNIIFPFMSRFPKDLLLSVFPTEDKSMFTSSPKRLPDHTRISFFLIRLWDSKLQLFQIIMLRNKRFYFTFHA